MCSIDKKPGGEVATENQAAAYIPPGTEGGYEASQQQQQQQQTYEQQNYNDQ